MILADPEKTTARAYGVLNEERGMAMRQTVYIGPDGRILDVDTKVSPATAGQDVVTRLEALKVKKKKT